MMNAMSRMSPLQAGQTSGNASTIRASSLAHAMREVSWDRGLSVCVSAGCPACPGWPAVPTGNFPTLPIALAVTAARSEGLGANTP